MPVLKANVGCPRGSFGSHRHHMASQRLPLGALGAAYCCSEAPNGCPWGPCGYSEAAFGGPWGCIWLLRGCIWLPTRVHVTGQGLHLAAEGLHFAAQGPSMAPMRQICSICFVWLGQAGQPGFQETAQFRRVGRSGAPNSRQQMAMKTVKMHSKLKTEDCQWTED